MKGTFFSSRRRHTKYWRDWSSAVCSSDLRRVILRVALPELPAGTRDEVVDALLRLDALVEVLVTGEDDVEAVADEERLDDLARSEERRGGNEGRSRWSPYH